MNSRLIACLITLVLLAGASLPLAAQVTTQTAESGTAYTVKSGDTAWQISGDFYKNPELWRHIVERNPFLQQKGRVVQTSKGWHVLLHPGEKLEGLHELGILPIPVALKDLGIEIPEPVVIREIPTSTWWILALAIALIIAAWLIYRMLTRDPVNSRPAMIQGGVTDETASSAIQQVAVRAAGGSHGNSRDPRIYQQFTIIRQTVGRIWGNMSVRYADGSSVPRRLNGDRAYQADVRFPDGHIETLYMLQGCGNDLRYGGISRYLPGPKFRFEADPTPVATPAPVQPEPTMVSEPAAQTAAPTSVQEAVAQTTPEPATQPASAPIEQPAVANGTVSFEFRRSSGDQPNIVRLTGIKAEEFFFTLGPNGTTLRFREAEEVEPVGATK